MEHILTPETEKHFFTDQILPPLLRGENLTIVWLPHCGVKTQMNFLIENSNNFGFRKLGKYLILYLNSNELIEYNPEGYFQLMHYCLDPDGIINDENKSSFFLLKEKIKKYLSGGFHLIFILAPQFDALDFPSTFFNNLHSFWQIEETKLHYVFVVSNNIADNERLKKYDQLGKLLSQNIVYFPILSNFDFDFVTNKIILKHNLQLSNEKIELAKKFVGGIPSLIKSCLQAFNKYPLFENENIFDLLQQQWEINVILEDIWKSFSSKEKGILSQLANGTFKGTVPGNLLKLRIIQFNDEKPQLFSPLFELFVSKQMTEHSQLSIDEKNGQLLINGLPPKEKITLNEHRLLTALLKKPNEIVTRDQISEILWGKESFNKYSDWAIDQTISLLRKKLEALEIPANNIQTIKGQGYRWTG